MTQAQSNRQSRIAEIVRLRNAVDGLREKCSQIASKLRSAHRKMMEPGDVDERGAPATPNQIRLQVAKQLKDLNREPKAMIRPVQLLKREVDAIIDECCYSDLGGDTTELEAWRNRLDEVYPINEEDVREGQCEPLYAVLRAYKFTLTQMEKKLTQDDAGRPGGAGQDSSQSPGIGLQLKQARDLAGQSQQTVAELFNRSVSTVSRIERGELHPSPELKKRIEQYISEISSACSSKPFPK